MKKRKKAEPRSRRNGHNMVDKIASSNIWLTPDSEDAPVLTLVRACSPDGVIGLDPCTEASNPSGALRYFTAADNGLAKDWRGYGLVFCNPPYSRTPAEEAAKVEPPIRPWSRKIHEQAVLGVTIVALLPCGARFSTAYWQDHILVPELVAACFWRGRIPFINGKTGEVGSDNNYDSMIYGFNVNVERFCEVWAPYGAVFAMKRHIKKVAVAPARLVLPF